MNQSAGIKRQRRGPGGDGPGGATRVPPSLYAMPIGSPACSRAAGRLRRDRLTVGCAGRDRRKLFFGHQNTGPALKSSALPGF